MWLKNIMWLLKLSCDTNTNFTWWSCDYGIIEIREEKGRIGQPAEFIAKVTRVNLLIRFLKKYILFSNNWIKVWLSWRSIFGQNYVFSGQKIFWMKMTILKIFGLKKLEAFWATSNCFEWNKTHILLKNKKIILSPKWTVIGYTVDGHNLYWTIHMGQTRRFKQLKINGSKN